MDLKEAQDYGQKYGGSSFTSQFEKAVKHYKMGQFKEALVIFHKKYSDLAKHKRIGMITRINQLVPLIFNLVRCEFKLKINSDCLAHLNTLIEELDDQEKIHNLSLSSA